MSQPWVVWLWDWPVGVHTSHVLRYNVCMLTQAGAESSLWLQDRPRVAATCLFSLCPGLLGALADDEAEFVWSAETCESAFALWCEALSTASVVSCTRGR